MFIFNFQRHKITEALFVGADKAKRGGLNPLRQPPTNKGDSGEATDSTSTVISPSLASKHSQDDDMEYKAFAHEAFDQLWKKGLMTRGQAYAWLKTHFGKRHIADMTKSECYAVANRVQRYYPHLVN